MFGHSILLFASFTGWLTTNSRLLAYNISHATKQQINHYISVIAFIFHSTENMYAKYSMDGVL